MPLFPLSLKARIGRRAYAAWGLGLFAVKFNLDRWLSTALFDRPWSLWSYLDVPGMHAITALSQGDVRLAFTLASVALPFVVIGTLLTVARLRDAGRPLWPVLLFFAPVVNLIVFSVLAVLPSRNALPPIDTARRPGLGWVPTSRLGAAAVAVLLVVPPALLMVWMSVTVFDTYGWSVFVGIPFLVGFVAGALYRRQGGTASTAGVGMLAVVVLGGMLMVFAIEGVLCLLMALPIGLALGALGGAVGGLLADSPQSSVPPQLSLVGAAVAPLLLLGVIEQAAPPTTVVRPVSTSIVLAAAPEAVWPHVIAFPDLPTPTDWFFRAGVAYPLRARIEGSGVGAVRYCEFTTGPFVEPITAWEPGRLLAFDVRAQPQPMQEWTFWKDLHPAHLDGFFHSQRGEFRLEPLDGGRRTRLTGTTWYTHDVWPEAYWSRWADYILHRIHRRVLDHVATQTRRPATPSL